MFPTIICYYTKDTPYEEEIKGLIASCEKHNLPYSIDPIHNFGSWEANCCFKPQYILQKLTDLKKPVLWIDADAIVYRKPTIFETLKGDVAVFVDKELPNNNPSKMPSGTIFFNDTENAKDILKKWEKETKHCLSLNPSHWDQVSLCTVLLNSSASIFSLEDSYYQIYNNITDKETLDRSFIIHFQASRTLKKTLNKEIIPFWDESLYIQSKKEKFLENIIN